MQNISEALRTFSNPLKTFQKNLHLERNPLKVPYLNFKAKLLTRAYQEICLEVRGMQWEAKFLKERKRHDNNTNFVRLRILQKFMACNEVLIPRNKLKPPSPKMFKPIQVLKIYPYPLLPKTFNSPLTLFLKLFNPSYQSKININMNFTIEI